MTWETFKRRRRRRVPTAWREEHHRLYQRTRYYAGGGYAGSREYRSGGTCSCGATFGLDAGDHTATADDVRDEYRDHVEAAYYGEELTDDTTVA